MLQLEHIYDMEEKNMANEMLSEKVSVNINSSTLSNIDLLVDNGYYSNRSDFINQAVRSALQQHQTTIDRIIDRHTGAQNGENGWFIGVSGYTAAEIEKMYQEGICVSVKGYGVFAIDEDCDREKLYSVIKSISVRGKTICPADIRKHYGIK